MSGGDRRHHGEAAVFAAGDQCEHSVPHGVLKFLTRTTSPGEWEMGLKFNNREHLLLSSCRFVLILLAELTAFAARVSYYPGRWRLSLTLS